MNQIKNNFASPVFFLGGVFLCSFLLFALTELFRGQLYLVLDASMYLVFHNIVEFFSIIASFGIFILAWFTYKQSEDNGVLVLGCMFLGVGLLDFMHALSFPGEPTFFTASSTNKGILFWLSARLLFAAAFLASAFMPQVISRFRYWRQALLMTMLLYASAVFYAIIYHESALPAMFIPGSGLTPLKIYLEYTVIVLLALAYLAYVRAYFRRRETAYLWCLAAINISIFSELAFTLYKSAYDTFNMLGHLYKFLAFSAIYVGVFIAAIRRPYVTLSETVAELQKNIVLRKGAEKYIETLAGSIHAIIVCLDLEGRVINFNEAAEKITGYRKDEVMGRNWFELVAPRDRFPEVWKAFEEFQKKGGSIVGDFENPILTKSGEERIIEWHNSDLRQNNVVIGTISYGTDITERKRAEKERKMHLWFSESLDRVNQAMLQADNLEQMMRSTLSEVLAIFDSDRTWLFYPCDPDSPTFRVPMEVSKPEYPGAGILKEDVPLPPDMAENLREVLGSSGPITYIAGTERPINKVSAEKFGVKSMILVALYPKSGKPWVFGMHQCSRARVWQQEEKDLFKEIGRRLSDSLGNLLAYQALQKSEEKYRTLVDTTNEGVLVLDAERKITFTNPRMLQMLGYSKEEMKEKRFEDLIAPEEMADHLHKMEERRSGKGGTYERRFIRKDGRVIVCNVSATPLFDEQRRFVGSFGMLIDITEHKQAEDALRKSEEALKKAQRLGRIGNWDWDMATDTITWSDEYYRIFGFDPAQPPPNYEEHLKVYTPESAARLDAAVKENTKTGKSYELDLEIANPKSTTRWITARSETVYDAQGKITGLRGTAQDITEHKREEERLKELDKIKDDFLMVTTHELKSPLIPIKSQAQLLLAGDYGELNDGQKEAVEMIHRNEESLNLLASELLDIAKIQSDKLKLEFESASVGDLVTEVVSDMKTAAEQKGLSLSLLPIPELPSIRIDRPRVGQVIRNLLDNAIKFTLEHGTISIEVEKIGREIAVHVKDSGIGIGKDDIAKLFVPFFRAESDVTRKYRGTGLGLAVSKGIVNAHGGTIRAESEGVGKGSVFTFTLPIRVTQGA